MYGEVYKNTSHKKELYKIFLEVVKYYDRSLDQKIKNTWEGSLCW